MTAKLEKLVIDRQRWARGAPPRPQREVNFLLGGDGTLCCLGFCMAQLGVPAYVLLKEGKPYKAIRENDVFFDNVSDMLVDAEEETVDDGEGEYEETMYRDSALVTLAIDANDSEKITEPEREALIKKVFAPFCEVIFVDTPEETAALCGMPVDFGGVRS
jgi:hypothetical protein